MSEDNQQPIQEIDILQRFSHPCIVRYLGCRQEGDIIEIAYDGSGETPGLKIAIVKASAPPTPPAKSGSSKKKKEE